MKRTFLSLIILTLLFSGFSCVKKPGVFSVPITVIRVAGPEASLVTGENKIPVTPGMAVTTNDTVITGKLTKIILRVGAENTCVLDQNSCFKPSRLAAMDGQSEIRLFVLTGKFASFVHKLSKDSSFEIQTPTAVAGVRGTEFSVAVGKDGASTTVVYEGTVEVSRPQTAEVVSVTASNRVVVPSQSAEKPVLSGWDKNDVEQYRAFLSDAAVAEEKSVKKPEPAQSKAMSPVHSETVSQKTSTAEQDVSIPVKTRTLINEDFSGVNLNRTIWMDPWHTGSLQSYVGLGRLVMSGTNNLSSWAGGGMNSRPLMVIFPEADLASKKWMLEVEIRFKPDLSTVGWEHGISFSQGTFGQKNSRGVKIAVTTSGAAIVTSIDQQVQGNAVVPYTKTPEVRMKLMLVYDPTSKKVSAYKDGVLIGTRSVELPPTSQISVGSSAIRSKFYAEYDNINFNLAE